ncbi:MAG TPA: sigma-70 family RNA polymerase sigma factor, partial [Alphaproteobacteria bacterium]|nr:sigma-70 family RNA polymerase sigma factor [Alphaproteobacteria bacterium]
RKKSTLSLDQEIGEEGISFIDLLPASGPGPGESVAAAEAVAQVYGALETLPRAQREAVALRLVEDLSYEEIAQAAGCSVGTVKSRLHYGLERLRAELSGVLEDWREVL